MLAAAAPQVSLIFFGISLIFIATVLQEQNQLFGTKLSALKTAIEEIHENVEKIMGNFTDSEKSDVGKTFDNVEYLLEKLRYTNLEDLSMKTITKVLREVLNLPDNFKVFNIFITDVEDVLKKLIKFLEDLPVLTLVNDIIPIMMKSILEDLSNKKL
ncbi:DUF148 domain-containing protein [Caenorhabditis elegans]|uniref:DUF148 domain-containing protein n=1 Tax=Caenorhabditis elegans TaxID=6239 RepID=Q9TZ73_CAEEL|nr:DUF148 domain-containing protein [Caenorhabditis elegans]CCD70931.1 DUF148 domain-containing protein [Caenorhabditis elegans]|eukprot:NP_497170.1 Uncharacterized protein CELE_F40G9.6 [Caenorhabditis elegans]